MSRFSDPRLGESQAISLLLCEQIIVDAASGKRSLIGIFDTITSVKFPATFHNFRIYVCVARGGSSDRRFYVALEAPDGELVVQAIFDVDDWGPTEMWHSELRTGGITLASPGEYRLRLFVEGRVLRERRLLVQKLPESPEEPDDLPIS